MVKRTKLLTSARRKRYVKLINEGNKYFSHLRKIVPKGDFYKGIIKKTPEELLAQSMIGKIRRPWRVGKFKKGNTVWKLRKNAKMAGYRKRRSYAKRRKASLKRLKRIAIKARFKKYLNRKAAV